MIFKKKRRLNTENTIKDIENNVVMLVPANNNKQLAEQFDYLTEQQRVRDAKITELLCVYVSAYNDKVEANKKYKSIILWFCIVVLSIFTLLFAGTIVVFLQNEIGNIRIEGVISLVSICITYLSLIVGVLTIVAKHIFPAKEEKNITEIVKAIQENDFQNKKENIKAHFQEEKMNQKKGRKKDR